jgi:hypothetical protein
MAEHRGDRPCVARSVGQMAPMRAPCACGISKTKTHNEDRRLDENGEHRIRPVVAPPAVSSLPTCDDIMVSERENLPPAETFCLPKLPRKWSARGDHARFAVWEKQQSTSLKASVTRHSVEQFAVATKRQSRELLTASAPSQYPQRFQVGNLVPSGAEEHEPEHPEDQHGEAG